MSAHILVVEDEVHLAEGIRENLEAEGYSVDIARDGLTGLDRWRAGGVDLIVLDVMLPRMDGLVVCETIRREGGQLPILFLTAKNTESDRVGGLDVGGDDYLGKPFSLRELLSRVKAMLRRQQWYGALPPGISSKVMVAGHTVDFARYEIMAPSGERELLPQKEIMILKMLVERPDQVVSREDILDCVWGYDVFPSTRTVDNFIVRLRKRFEADPSVPHYIHTVRGVGYRYTPAGSRDVEQL